MSTISLRLPESLHAQARVMAEREGISINQLIATSLAEKLAALMTHEYLEARAARASGAAFQGEHSASDSMASSFCATASRL